MTTTLMRAEIDEAPAAVRRLLDQSRDAIAEAGARLRAVDPNVIVTVARGSSDHASAFFKYACEISTGVPVVAAQVRGALDLAPVRKVVVFLDRQRVEVGAKPDGPATIPDRHRGDDPVLPDARRDVVSPLLEQARDVPGGLVLPHRELGVAMHVLEPRPRLPVLRFQRCEDRVHDGAPGRGVGG